jgi:hypothetical protein
MLFGPRGSGARAQQVHLIDFGMATRRCDDATVPSSPPSSLPTPWSSPSGATVPSSDDGEAGAADGCGLRYGGGTPLFASVAEHEGRTTRPCDDVESLWYCLAYLAHGELPWKCKQRTRTQHAHTPERTRSRAHSLAHARGPAEPRARRHAPRQRSRGRAARAIRRTRALRADCAPARVARMSRPRPTRCAPGESPERAAAIKRRLFADACAIVEDDCSAQLLASDGVAADDGVCQTAHCRETVQGWLDGAPPTADNMVGAAEALERLWAEVLESEASPNGAVDYERCFRALGGDGEELLRASEPLGP